MKKIGRGIVNDSINDSIKVRDQSVTSYFRSFFRGALIVAALAIPATSRAASVVLTAGDALGATSFNAAGNWSPAGAPSAGNTYSTLGFLLRSPTGAGNYTFAGDSLTVGGGNGGGANPFSPVSANNDCFIAKIGSASTFSANWILDGAQIRDGLGNGDSYTIGGTIAVTANGGSFVCQATQNVSAAISGSSIVYIGDHGAGANSARVVVFQSAANTFNGNVELTNTANNATQSLLTLAPGSLWNFKPQANGVNNSIFGTGSILLGGNLAIDLTGADNTLGDTWQLVAPTSASFIPTYGGTFAVNGFTQNATLWDASANGTTYEFSQATGLLTVVPEPATMSLIGMGLGFGALLLRRKHSRA
jgi:hypothetical protein